MISVRLVPYSECCDSIGHLLGNTYKETLAPLTDKELYYNRQERLALAAQGKFVIAVAYDDNKVIGYCSFAIRRSWYDGRWYASEDAIYISPEYRKGTLFKELWNCAEQECVRRGVKEIQFIMPQSIIQKIKLWLRIGYKQTGVVLTKHY